MGKFHYCSSKDEADWYVYFDMTSYIELTESQVLYIGKPSIRRWIENMSEGEVYGWNGVSTPMQGDPSWAKKIAPQGGIVLYFIKPSDLTLFCLTFNIR